MLRAVAAHVRPGGVVVFHELDWDGVRSSPAVPGYDRCCQLARKAIGSAAETSLGGKLFSTYVAAGLAAPALRLEAVVDGGANASGPLRLVADLVGSLSDTIEQLDLALAEAQATESVVIGHFQFGAWSRM